MNRNGDTIMGKNTTTTVTANDIATLTRSVSITADNLPLFVAAVRESIAGDGNVMYGRTLVFRAAKNIGGKDFDQSVYAKEIGMSTAYVSRFGLLSLFVDAGFTPEATSEIGRKRWTMATSNATSAVRKAVRAYVSADKDKRPAALDALDVALGLKAKPESDEDKNKRGAQDGNDGTPEESGTPGGTVQATASQSLDLAVQRVLTSWDKMGADERDAVRKISAALVAHLAADDKAHAAPEPVKSVRGKRAPVAA